MNDATEPIYLAKMHLKPQLLREHSELIWDVSSVVVLRSVLMKPEHLAYTPRLHERLTQIARRVGGSTCFTRTQRVGQNVNPCSVGGGHHVLYS